MFPNEAERDKAWKRHAYPTRLQAVLDWLRHQVVIQPGYLYLRLGSVQIKAVREIRQWCSVWELWVQRIH